MLQELSTTKLGLWKFKKTKNMDLKNNLKCPGNNFCAAKACIGMLLVPKHSGGYYDTR